MERNYCFCSEIGGPDGQCIDGYLFAYMYYIL